MAGTFISIKRGITGATVAVALAGAAGVVVSNGTTASAVNTAPTNVAALAAGAAAGQAVVALPVSKGYPYVFNPSSTLTADGVYVVNPASGSGKWEATRIGAETFRYANKLYVDCANAGGAASDENNCTAQATPCRTNREVARRLGGVLAEQTLIYELSAIPATDGIGQFVLRAEADPSVTPPTPTWFGSGNSPTLLIIGKETVARSSTATAAATNPTTASQTPGTFTDSAISSFTSDVGTILRSTNGSATAAMAWVVKGQSTNVARMSWWSTEFGNLTSTLPANGDAYSTYTLTTVADPQLPVVYGPMGPTGPNNRVWLAYLEFTTGAVNVRGGGGAGYSFNACKFDNTVNQYDTNTVYNENYFGGSVILRPGSTANFTSNAFVGGDVAGNGNAYTNFTSDILQGRGISASTGALLNLTNVGIFDKSGIALQVQQAARVFLGTDLWGSNNTTGTTCASAGGIISLSSIVPHLGATGTELSISCAGGTSTGCFTALTQSSGAVQTASGGVIANTWALWNTNLAKKYFDWGSGCFIVGG